MYHIICAKYERPVDFLEKIPITYTVIEKGDIFPQVPNKGNEASSYLFFIIHHYEHLPENMIFIQDEDESWHHTGKISENIYSWIDDYEKRGFKYYEFNDMDIDKDHINKEKNELFNQYQSFHYEIFYNDCLKDTIGPLKDVKPEVGKCCAQFIVSKQVVLNKPKMFYFRMYTWIMKNTTESNNPNDPFSSYNTGRYLEWSWRFIFNNMILSNNYSDSYINKPYL